MVEFAEPYEIVEPVETTISTPIIVVENTKTTEIKTVSEQSMNILPETDPQVSEPQVVEPEQASAGEPTTKYVPMEEREEDEYKEKCTEMWHDDIFFSKSNLKGRYVKLDLFVEEGRFWSLEQSMASPTYEFIQKYNLQRSFYFCGVNRQEEYSYIGGQLNMYISNDSDCSEIDIVAGDHLIVYGQIVDYSRNTLDGYNECYFIPRFIETRFHSIRVTFKRNFEK